MCQGYNSLYGLIGSCFRCLDSILNAHDLSTFSVAEHASLNQYRLQTPKTWLLIKWLMYGNHIQYAYRTINTRIKTCISNIQFKHINVRSCVFIGSSPPPPKYTSKPPPPPRKAYYTSRTTNFATQGNKIP